MLRPIFLTALLFGAIASAAFAGDIPSEGRSMPPAIVESSKAVLTEQFLGNADGAYRIEAAAWVRPVAAASSQKSLSVAGERAKPVQVGYPREIPASLRDLPLASLRWTVLGDGGRTVQVQVVASDAAGLRIAYRVDGPANGLELRFSGSGRDQVFRSTVVPSAEIAWSPVLEGSTGTVELHVLPGFDPAQFNVTFDQVSHLVKAGAELNKTVSDIGRAGSCNVDIACVSNPSPALLNIAKATAQMVFSDASGTYVCTGTLLNSTSGADYFYSAAHCISSQSAASTLNTYWFFDAVACNSTAVPPYQLVGGGATLVLTDPTMDVTLLQLRLSPPTGAVRAAWNATVFTAGTVTVDLHHPSGDLKKFSQGVMQGYVQGPLAYDGVPRFQAGKDSFISVRWAQGTTEGGSSGSGVFTFNTTGGYYELRGGLEGGAASCENPTGLDRFSRMDLLYTKLAPYLQPAAVIPSTTSAQASMVEYWNPQNNFYFMTSREPEKAALDTLRDSQANPLWYRTGYWFKTDTTASSTTSSINRYYIPGAAKNASRGTHFYTALNADKMAITGTGKERFPSPDCSSVPNTFFCNEGIDSFISLPIGLGAASTCLAGEQKIWRAYRASPADDGNHRYLNNQAMYDYMVNEQKWNGEFVNFCAKL